MRILLPLLVIALACTNAERETPAVATADSTLPPVALPPVALPPVALPPVAMPPVARAPLTPSEGDSATEAVTDSVIAAIRACPRDGRWHRCSVEHRLELSGLRPRAVDSVTRIPGLSIDAHLWQIGRQSIRAVLFDDAAQASAALAGLDSARAAPRGDNTVAWTDRPTLIHSVNLVALMLGGTDRQVERVSNALTAGPPQPER